MMARACRGLCEPEGECQGPIRKVRVMYQDGTLLCITDYCQEAIRTDQRHGFRVDVMDGPTEQEQPQ